MKTTSKITIPCWSYIQHWTYSDRLCFLVGLFKKTKIIQQKLFSHYDTQKLPHSFIILKTFHLSSESQHKNWSVKICTVAKAICQKVVKFWLAKPNHQISIYFGQYLGLDVNFFTPVFALKPKQKPNLDHKSK